MIEVIQPLVMSIAMAICQVLMHEAGHYLVAYKLHWQPRLSFRMLAGWMPSIAVITKAVEININSNEDFFKWHVNLISFIAGGYVMALIAVILEHWLGFFNDTGALGFVVIWSLYLIWELTHPEFGEKQSN